MIGNYQLLQEMLNDGNIIHFHLNRTEFIDIFRICNDRYSVWFNIEGLSRVLLLKGYNIQFDQDTNAWVVEGLSNPKVHQLIKEVVFLWRNIKANISRSTNIPDWGTKFVNTFYREIKKVQQCL